MNTKRKKGLPFYPGAKLLYTKLVILIILEGAAIIGQAYFLSQAITRLFQGKPVTLILSDIGLFALAFILRYFILQVETYLSENHARETARTLRQQIFQAHFKQTSLQNSGTGHFVTLAMEGVDHAKTYIEIIGARTIKTMIIPALIALFIFTMDHNSAYIMVVAVPIIIIFMILLGIAAQKMADKQYKTFENLSNHFMDSLKGLETLAYIGKSKAHGKQIKTVSEDYRKATMKTLRVAFLSSFALDFFTSLSIAFVAVGLGIRLVDGSILLFPALTILLLVPEYFSPIKQVGKDYHATLDGQIALNDIESLLTQEAPMLSYEKIMWQKNSHLALKNIVVEKENQTILKQVNFNLSKGLHGLIGTSGSGKTTLLQVLAGRLPSQAGQYRLDGETLPSLMNPTWYEHIAYIPQHPYIFPLTLRENLTFYQPNQSDENVSAIIDDIGLTAFVASLPKGLDEKLGEGGRIVSGGQAQRIALARALLSHREIILLDEPTAHLDIETEYEVKQLILKLFRDKTVVIATHRMHWVNDLDRVTRISQGELNEMTLETRGDRYA